MVNDAVNGALLDEAMCADCGGVLGRDSRPRKNIVAKPAAATKTMPPTTGATMMMGRKPAASGADGGAPKGGPGAGRGEGGGEGGEGSAGGAGGGDIVEHTKSRGPMQL